MGRYQTRITVKEIKGHCYVHKVGDTYLIEKDGYTLRFDKAHRLCTYALSAMLPVFSALSRELEKEDWMAAKTLIFQCPDAGPEMGGDGTVYFEIKREKA